MFVQASQRVLLLQVMVLTFGNAFDRECRVNYRHCYNKSIKAYDFVNVFKDNIVVSKENISAHDALNEVMHCNQICDQIIELQGLEIKKSVSGLNKSDARDCNELTFYAYYVCSSYCYVVIGTFV